MTAYWDNIIGAMHAYMESYAQSMFYLLAPWCLVGFKLFVLIWLILQFGYKAAFKGELSWTGMTSRVLGFVVVVMLLQQGHIFWQDIYGLLTMAADDLFRLVASVDPRTHHLFHHNSALAVIDAGFERILLVPQALLKNGGLFNIVNLLVGLVMFACYLYMVIVFIFYLLDYYLKGMVLSALAPIWIVACAFKPSRGAAKSALMLWLHGAMTLVLGMIVMSVILHILQATTHTLPIDAQGFQPKAADWMFGAECIGTIMLGFMGCAFMMKAQSMAGSVLNVQDGSATAPLGMLAAGAMAATGVAGTAMWQGMKKGGSFILGQSRQHANLGAEAQVQGDGKEADAKAFSAQRQTSSNSSAEAS